MNVCIYSVKGGVGKTNLSFSLAKDLGYALITNDSSIVTKVYSKSKYIDKTLPLVEDCIYDLGGFITGYVSDLLNQVDKVIVPAINDYNALIKALEVIDFVGADKCIVIANMLDSQKDFEEIKAIIQKKHDVLVFPLKRSKIFRNGLESGNSLLDIYNESGLTKHTYKSIKVQYETILKAVNNG